MVMQVQHQTGALCEQHVVAELVGPVSGACPGHRSCCVNMYMVVFVCVCAENVCMSMRVCALAVCNPTLFELQNLSLWSPPTHTHTHSPPPLPPSPSPSPLYLCLSLSLTCVVFSFLASEP